jgi:hypothetical protein
MNITKGLRWLAGVMALAAFSAVAQEAKDFKMGEIRVDSKRRAVSFPAQVNMTSGQMEYLVVHETGKIHESIFKTAVSPKQLHAAALLFSSGTNDLKVDAIEISWKEKKFQAAELILDKKQKRALRETKWAYRGSRLVDGSFMAEREGSIIAIREDRHALIDQDTPDAADDENWEPMKDLVPDIGTPVTIVIRFAE